MPKPWPEVESSAMVNSGIFIAGWIQCYRG